VACEPAATPSPALQRGSCRLSALAGWGSMIADSNRSLRKRMKQTCEASGSSFSNNQTKGAIRSRDAPNQFMSLAIVAPVSRAVTGPTASGSRPSAS
jgi:hypothetical protein